MRILKDKTGLYQRFLPVEGHAIQKHNALRIDKHPDIFEFEDVVLRARRWRELELITQARAAAPHNPQPQTAGYAFASKSFTYLLYCLGCDMNLLRRWFLC